MKITLWKSFFHCRHGIFFFTVTWYLFADVDECKKRHLCSPFASCVNTEGSFTCTCQYGYSGNGTLCSRKHLKTNLCKLNKSAFNWCCWWQIYHSTEDLQTNEFRSNEEMKVTGNWACALRVSSHPYLRIKSRVKCSRPAAVIELVSWDLKTRAVPLGHAADKFVFVFFDYQYWTFCVWFFSYFGLKKEV